MGTSVSNEVLGRLIICSLMGREGVSWKLSLYTECCGGDFSHSFLSGIQARKSGWLRLLAVLNRRRPSP